jgi:hypothetical protein
MQIEEGKFYRDRTGEIIGPMRRSGRKPFPWTGVSTETGNLVRYTESGRHNIRDGDLVEECAAPADTLSDQLADAISANLEQNAPAIMPTEPAFASLAGILQAAHDQAASGKGRERHSDDKPFLDQPIMEIARMLAGIDGHSFQIMKKAQEAARMVRREQFDAAVRELLGVINYAAAAVLLIREQ